MPDRSAATTLDSAYAKLHAILDPVHFVVGESITEDEATALLALSREVEVLRDFYERTCESILEHDRADETVRLTVERVRRVADQVQEALDGEF